MTRNHLLWALTAALVLLHAFPAAVRPAFAASGETLNTAADEISLDPSLRILLAGDPGRVPGAPDAGRGSARQLLPRSLQGALLEPDGEQIEVFLEARAALTAAPDQGVLRAVGGDLYAGRVSLGELRRMIDAGEVSAARLSRPVRSTLDRSTAHLGLGRLRRLDHGTGFFEGATGKGVVFGIVDTGLDGTHPDFRRSDGGTRVFRYWDQWVNSGPSPPEFLFGSEYTTRHIDTGLADLVDLTGHGTHVAGIAAGSGIGSYLSGADAPFAGVAPEATLIAVRSNFTEVGVVFGAQYIFDRAGLLGYPAVINLSLGNHFGPHVGNTLFERSLQELVGPGRLLVAAAGNEAARDIHAEMDLPPGEVGEVRLSFPGYDKEPTGFTFVLVEGWFPLANRYRFSVVDPLGEEVGSLVFGDLGREFASSKGLVRGWYTDDEGWGSLMVEIGDNPRSGRLATGEWTLRAEALSVTGEPELDFWLVTHSGIREGAFPRFLDHVDPNETIISPATAHRILAVGAISTRACWPSVSGQRCYPQPPVSGGVAFFSSRGPTPDGRRKPEIMAPGFGVVSALSRLVSPGAVSPEEMSGLSTPDGLYWINQGTSMAAPHVAGTVALLLQKYPVLSFEQTTQRLRSRGTPLVDWRSNEELVSLRTGEALMPIVDLALSEALVERRGVRLRWFVGKEREPTRYRIYKAFEETGPYFALLASRITGGNPYEILDTGLEPGRRHLYRLVAVDGHGLEEELDTLRVDIAGTPRPTLRAPDPNPARTGVSLGYFIPPCPAGGEFRVEMFDVRGRHVAEVDRGVFGPEGTEATAEWNLLTSEGTRPAAGVYFARMRLHFAGGGAPATETRRVVVLP
jgi:subtilisin family serine protease